MPTPRFVNNLSDLHILVYLVGYPEMGESIIVIMKDMATGVIHHSCAIDCYKTTLNKTQQILSSHGITSLDFLCWTHTDKDHSIGLEDIIKSNCTDKTCFVLPEGLTGSDDDFVKYDADTLACFNLINPFNVNSNYRVFSASASSDGYNFLQGWEFEDNAGQQFNYNIFALSPNSSLLRRRVSGGIKKKNDLSIALIFKIGELSLFMTSDIENQTLRLINKDLIADVDYLKTPHHTSTSSDYLLEIFEEINTSSRKIPFTCSTVFKQHDLPDTSLMNNYKKYTDKFFCTGYDQNKADDGVIKVEYNIATKLSKHEIFGNAEQKF